jgi:ubiquinone biosynthesis monooxygenase Coq6
MTPPSASARCIPLLRSTLDATAPHTRLVMPPRLPLGAPRAITSSSPHRVCIRLHRRFASTSADVPEVYDVVCVGGGPAGLSLLAGLKASPVTSGLKVALIEGQDLQKNRLPKDASLDSFSNRCSSLTPASVKNLQGT